jgi:exonuclease III
MMLLSWNCRGLGKPSAIRALKKTLQSHKPDIVFLMETKLQSSEFQKRIKIPGDMFPNSCIVDCTISNSNGSGGLAMLVSKDVKIDIIAYNERVIDCYVDCSNNNVGWRAYGIYGFSNNQQKPQTCDLIQNLFKTMIMIIGFSLVILTWCLTMLRKWVVETLILFTLICFNMFSITFLFRI